ncbi:hypothetical protein [Streptomyces clavuligerus]|uniref:hypothetical protein n=1 Tax=Streptomyces clavuligerus TaxID=1901 RepID=UPI001E33F27F|nr:hypothetical protein [Streptomyces clavuligerus]WDN57476.1 hypothetical protein LL058_37540 [Streptomyces clavuligerus]
MVRTRRFPDGAVALVVGALAITAELVAFLVPAPVRPGVGVIVAGAVFLGLLVWMGMAVKERFRGRCRAPTGWDDGGGEWFTRQSLEGFPRSEVCARTGGAGLVRAEEAWVFARHGYGTAWLTSRLGVSNEVARTLVRAVQEQAVGVGRGSSGAEADGLDQQ